MAPTIQKLGQSLDHWQALYIVSITIALLSTFAIVYFAFHKRHPTGSRVSNYVYTVASFLAVLSTIVVVNKAKSLDGAKSLELESFKTDARIKIAQANAKAEQAKADAAVANQKAQEAKDETAKVEAENLKLDGQVGKDAVEARTAEAALAKANKETSDFAHGVAMQQQNMTQQAKLSPVLDSNQIAALAVYLRPFSGQNVTVHTTLDTVVLRLGNGIQAALAQAGLKPHGTMDAGSTYQGVSVVVHSPQDVPPLANALVFALRAQGISVTPAADTSVAQGQVSLYLGPN